MERLICFFNFYFHTKTFKFVQVAAKVVLLIQVLLIVDDLPKHFGDLLKKVDHEEMHGYCFICTLASL